MWPSSESWRNAKYSLSFMPSSSGLRRRNVDHARRVRRTVGLEVWSVLIA